MDVLSEFIVCATEVESNLIAMGFEVTSGGAIAQLPDRPTIVPQTAYNPQMSSVKSAGSATSRSVADKPVVTPTNSKIVGGTAATNAEVSMTGVADDPQQSLYKIIRQRSQMKLSTEEEQSRALSSDAIDSVLTHCVDEDGGQHPQRESTVKFCLENNAFISASSAEESQCR